MLIGFTVTRVLGNDHAGNVFKHLSWAQKGAIFQQLSAHHTLCGRIAGSNGVVVMPDHLDGRQLMCPSNLTYRKNECDNNASMNTKI
jgi:hypothetical protein